MTRTEARRKLEAMGMSPESVDDLMANETYRARKLNLAWDIEPMPRPDYESLHDAAPASARPKRFHSLVAAADAIHGLGAVFATPFTLVPTVDVDDLVVHFVMTADRRQVLMESGGVHKADDPVVAWPHGRPPL